MKNRLFQHYLENNDAVRPFYGRNIRDEGAWRSSAERASKRACNPAVVSALTAYHDTLPASEAQRDSIKALGESDTIAVITGQQVGLYLGPSFTLYKVLSAIETARKVERETGKRTVCIFWLQSEDHDFSEVRTTYLPNSRHEVATIALDSQQPADSRVSVAHLTLGPSILACNEALSAHLSQFPHAAHYLELFRKHYTPDATITQAFARTLCELFRDDGLVIVDPTHPALSEVKKPIFSEALSRWQEIASVLGAQVSRLRDAGYAEQIHVREDSPLFFYHPEGPKGPRYRLTHSADGWQLVGAAEAVPHDVLENTLREQPECFSSSALLRPILQDSLFPTAAYIAGPAEIAYFAELPPLYELFSLPFPTLIPRARFRIVEPQAQKLLDELKLATDDLMHPEDELLAKLGAAQELADGSAETLGRQVQQGVTSALALFRERFAAVDQTLTSALDKAEQKITHQISKLDGRYLRALAEKDTVARDRLRRLKNMLVPNYIEQERVFGAPYFLCRYGGELLDLLRTQLDLTNANQKDLYL